MHISYGQLYRWKRKGLIPEDWFVRKSSFTGQETFFPKERVLGRVEKILSMKDGQSLDELADLFSPSPASLEKIRLAADVLAIRNIVSASSLKLYCEFRGFAPDATLGTAEILAAYVFGGLIDAGSIARDEGKALLPLLDESIAQSADAACEVYLLRRLGVFMCFSVAPPARVCLDPNARLISKINLASTVEELRPRLIEASGTAEQ